MISADGFSCPLQEGVACCMRSYVAPPGMSLGGETPSDLEAMATQEQSKQPAAQPGGGLTLPLVEASITQSSDPYFVNPTVGGEDFKTVLGLNSPDPETISFNLGINGDGGKPFQAVDIGSNSLDCVLTGACSTFSSTEEMI